MQRRLRSNIAKHLLPHLLITPQDQQRLRPVHLVCALLMLGAIATAGPTWEQDRPPFLENRAPLIIAIDLSPSMDANDVPPSRLEAAKHKLHDLITLEPPPPSAAGVVNLYSRDFYQLAASRLEPQGLVAQWLPLPTQNIDDSRSLVRSFLDVFPYATLWTSEFHEMLLAGSMAPIELDAAKISERFQRGSVRSTLQDVSIGSAVALLATWVTDHAGLERFAADAPAVTDDRPRIEYAPWVRPKEITRVLPALLDLRQAPVLVNADAGLHERMNAHQQRLMRFYRASLHAYDGDRDAWARDIREVMRGDGGNPYFRWFVGE